MRRASSRPSGVGPGLLVAGAGLLFTRTIVMLAGTARTVLKAWVVAMTLIEMFVDAVTMIAGARWWATRGPGHARFALRAGAVATVLHAVRVLVFVLGRTGPWVDFDVRPEHRADHGERWTWSGVIFAGVMSVLGILGAATIWRVRRQRGVRPSVTPVGC